LIVVFGSAIAWWLMQNRQRAPAGEEEKPASRPGPMGDPEALERTRRIQEAIPRKSTDRQRQTRGAGPEPAASQPRREAPTREPELPPILREMLGIPAPVAAPKPPPVPAFDRSAIERQERMQQQLLELEQQRREADALGRKVAAETEV